ncbi:MAG: hypothetical protein IKV03_05360 [Alphaproteobacteria bacterium]|nr:hypothetical protein [Alphaproteobacteria bacterium]
MKKVLILSSFLLLMGCSSTHIMVSKSYEPVTPEEVKVAFKEAPDCDYEEIAMIHTPYSWNSNSALKKARKQAAKIGADYIKITAVETNDDNDAKIEAVAYKCISFYD